jgi:integrase
LQQNPAYRVSNYRIYHDIKRRRLSYTTINCLIAPIFTFYQLNDIILNRKKVSRYLGEYKKVVRDKAYSTEQIQTALTYADQPMYMMLLILSSTACRMGSLVDLTLGKDRAPE